MLPEAVLDYRMEASRKDHSTFCFEVNEGELLHGETVGSLEKPKRRMGEDFLWHGNG
jgi:hypothetical protein